MEVERVRAEMPTPWDVAMLGLLSDAGLRPEEMYALRWIDVGEPVRTIDRALHLRGAEGTKTGQRRTVDIVPPLAADLASLRPDDADPDALVAPSESGGFLNTNNWRNRVWNPACQRADVRATTYDGRRTYASLLIHEGRSPLLVSVALGHRSGELVWRRYAHLFDAARHAPTLSMVAAIEAARAELSDSGVYPSCTRASSPASNGARLRA